MTLYVITGPPAAGKTTWVREHAKPGDIVIDYDLLAGALTAPGTNHSRQSKPVRGVTFRARAAAIHEALKHTGTVDVYVIHTLPSEQARDRYAAHNATVITVDPGESVVLERIRSMRSPSMVAVARRWYATRGDTPSTPAQVSRSW